MHASESVLVTRPLDGAYRLHVALEDGVSSDVVELLLQSQDPEATMFRNRWDETPLHVAYRRGASLTFVQSLMNRYEAYSVTCQGDIPLFLVCEADTSLDVIFLLMKLCCR
jgi:hypothetical protein